MNRKSRYKDRALVPESASEKRAKAIDGWRQRRMSIPGYQSLTTAELKRMNRLEAIRAANEKPRFAASYPESLVEVLPSQTIPAERQMMRYKKHRSGKMS